MVGQELVGRRVGPAVTAGATAAPPVPDRAGTAPEGHPLAVWLLLGAVAVAACVLFVVGVLPLEQVALLSDELPTLALVGALSAGFALAELRVVHVPVGRNTYTLTLSDIPLVVGLFFLAPVTLVLTRVLAALVPLAVRNRRSPRKLAFNVAWFGVEVTVATMLWQVVAASADGLGPVTWVAAGAVTVLVDLLGTALISLVMAVDSWSAPRAREVLSEANPAVALVNASAALVIVYVTIADWRALWAVGVVVAVLVFAQRSYNSLRRRTESLEQLGAFTGQLGAQLDVESAVRTALVWMTTALKADVVELTLTAEFAGEPRTWRARYGGDVVERQGDGAATALAPWLAAGPLLVRAGQRDKALGGALASAGLRDAVLMSLHGDGHVMGTLMVADRLGDVETFAASDLRELVAIGNHLGVALRNARRADLIREHADDQLRRSLHDDLTGLPNRRCLEQRLSELLSAGSSATTLLLDLDRFKEINDSLGHHAGDELLRMVADRLAGSVPAEALVAHLGGDEFAVLLPAADDPATASVVAMVRHAFAVPFALGELQVTVDASLGVAPVRPGGTATEALRHADIAMVAAKSRRTGAETYRAELQVGSPQRLTLLTDLRRAITSGELTVHFQPKLRLRDGEVLGAEALVRWIHPERGFIGPDEFIPVAEHSGLITPLTFAVLRQALDACASWRRAGRAMDVAVNMSPRSLLEPSFVDEVARALAVVEVPASALTLEITESSLMADPERAIEALQRLRDLGVQLSIDDLGTGYSSLAYLQRLPVTEVKIDRSFLVDQADGVDGFALVGAIVDMGHRLGRHVVAEGVETEEAWRQLQALGCDSAQGYWMGRPMSVGDFAGWLESWRPRQVAPLRSIG